MRPPPEPPGPAPRPPRTAGPGSNPNAASQPSGTAASPPAASPGQPRTTARPSTPAADPPSRAAAGPRTAAVLLSTPADSPSTAPARPTTAAAVPPRTSAGPPGTARAGPSTAAALTSTADQPPALGEALALVADRWKLTIVDALLDGPRRFGELSDAIVGIAPNILAQRLRHLEETGVVLAVPYSDRPVRFLYELTAAGHDLAGVLRLLADWGARHAGGEPLRHAACGAPLEARWYCPTCDQPADDAGSLDQLFYA